MSKRLDIEILEFLDKESNQSNKVDLIKFIKIHERETVYELVTQMRVDKQIDWTESRIDEDNKTIYSFEAKILPKGNDYLIDYKNRKSTRAIAITGIAIAIVSIILSAIALVTQD